MEPILSAKEMSEAEVEHLGIMAYAAYFTRLTPVKSLAEKAVIDGDFTNVYVGQTVGCTAVCTVVCTVAVIDGDFTNVYVGQTVGCTAVCTAVCMVVCTVGLYGGANNPNNHSLKTGVNQFLKSIFS